MILAVAFEDLLYPKGTVATAHPNKLVTRGGLGKTHSGG